MEKLSGPEMLVRTLIKATGINPEELKNIAMENIEKFHLVAESLQRNMKNIDENLSIINARLERLEAFNGEIGSEDESEPLKLTLSKGN